MERRAAGALLALAACFACSVAAPTASNQTSLDLYEGAPEGCYYNFQHYGEGDRIMTNEPCLNCTCHNRMLMCYLRVCPFTKAIGQDCTVEKRADQCCPIVTCPDVPVDLLTSTSTTSPAEYGATGLGKLDKYGCSINGKYFPEGSKVPPTPNKPCEHCYCIRNMTTCVMQECTLHVDGCTPIYHKDVCCPVRYSCDHLEDEMPLLDDMSTTVRPTPGFLLTTTTISPVTQMTQDCVHDDQMFADGALIKTEKACEHCYCMKGDIVCVVQECGAPMENEGKNCTSLAPREGQCCPDTYICEGDDLSSEIPTEATTESVMEMITTLLPPRRVGVEGSGYRNEPDEALYTAMPTIESEIEGSGEDHDTSKPEEGVQTIPPTEDGEQFISVTKVPMHDEYEHSTTESDKNGVDQTLGTHDHVATTISPIEKVTGKATTDEVAAELTPHEHYPISTERITTEYGEFLNTVPDEVHEVDDTKSHSESTTSEPIIEGSGSLSPIEHEDSRTTVTSEKEEIVTIAAVTSASEYNTPTGIPETMTEKELSGTSKDISTTTVAKIEEYTEKIEIESSTPEPFISSSTSVPVEEDIKLTTEPDHAQNTVAVAEEETTDSHIPKVTSVPDSSFEGEKTTVPNVEQESDNEKTVKDEVSRPSEFVPTATTALRDNELSTEEPDKGLNTIPNEVNEEATSEVPHLIGTKTTEPAIQDIDMKQTTISEALTLSPEIMVTKGDQYTVTTEPSFRKEDEISVSNKKPSFASTTVRPEFVDEGFIPTSTHDERMGSSSEAPSIEEDMTTFIPEYTKDLEEVEGSKQTTPEFIPDVSIVTESVPVKHSEPSVDHEGETLSSTEKSTETTVFVTEDVETHEEPSRIPGEGDCLLNGITYRNNSVVPSSNNCHTGCRCASSIIKCDPIICSAPPDYMDNCQSIYDSPDSCCPTYVCDHPRETVPPQSDNQMSGTESPPSSPTIECRGDQCEISQPVKQSTDRSEPCTGGSCLGETDHKSELPHTIPTCENKEDCKSVDILIEEATPCKGESCKKVDCTGDNCSPNDIFAPDHTFKIPQDIPVHDCTGEEPCRRKETTDTSEKIPSECDGPNCISETDLTVQDVVYSSTKSSIPKEEVTEKIELALGEKTTEVFESATKDTQELDSYTTEKLFDTMMPSKDADKKEPEFNEDLDTKKPMSFNDEATEKPEVSDNADKETSIDTKETITEKPLIDEDVKLKPTDTDKEVTYKPALTDDDGKGTSAIVDEITEKPTASDEVSQSKPTVIEEDVTEKPADTQATVTDIPALTDDGEKVSSTEIEEEITEKPYLADDDSKAKPLVIDEDITEKPAHIDEEVKATPTDIDKEVSEKPTLTDDDSKIRPTVIDEEVTEKPAVTNDGTKLKPTVIDEEVTKKPALFGDDEKETSTDIAEKVTDKPELTEGDIKVTSVWVDEITEKTAVTDKDITDDKLKPAFTDEDITDKPDFIDENVKAKPTIIDEDVTGKPDMTDEDVKIKPPVIDEDVTDKPALSDDDSRRKPTDIEEKITETPTLTDEHDKVQPTVIDEDVTGKPDFIDEDGKAKPTIIDEDITGKPDMTDEDVKIKPPVIDEDVTDKPALSDDDGRIKPTDTEEKITETPTLTDEYDKVQPTVIDEYVTVKPDLIDEDVKIKPTVIDEDITSMPDLIDEDGKGKPTVMDEDVTSKLDLIDEDGTAKPTVIYDDVTDKPALTDVDGMRKPTVTEEKITEKPTLTDEHDEIQPTVIDEGVTDKPVQIDEDGKGKPTDTIAETTQKPISIDDDGIIIPTVINDDVTQKPVLTDDAKQTPAIQEEVTEKLVVSDEDEKVTSATEEEITEKPGLTDEDDKIKPTSIGGDVTDKSADTQEKVTNIPALIDNDGKGSSTEIDKEVTEKPALTDDDGKMKPPVIDEDITEKPIQTDEDAIYKPTDADEKGTEKPILIDDDGKGTSPAMEVITEKPAIADIDVKELYTAIEEEITEKSTLTDDEVKVNPIEIDEEITDKPTLTDEDSKVKPTVLEEESTKKPASIDDDGKVKPVEGVTDESINEVTKIPPTVTEEGSGTDLPEIERTKPETEAQTPEISVHPTDSTTSELQEVTKTPYHESSTTLAAEDVYAFSTESHIELVDVTTSAPKEIVHSESPEIGNAEYVTKMPTKSQPEQEVTAVETYETTPSVTITSDEKIENETYDTTSPKQASEENPSTQASKLHDETESVETTKPSIGEQEKTSTDIPNLELLTTRKQEGGPVEIEAQEGPAGDKHKHPDSGLIDDEMTTKMYDESKIKPVPESHVTEQAMAVTPAYDISDLTEHPVQSSELPEIQYDKKKTPEIPETDKTKDEEYITEKDKTITESPISSADVSTEQQTPLETQKLSEEDTSTTIKSYLPETGTTELPDKAIGEVLEHSTQSSEDNKDKPDTLTDATGEPISVGTESQEKFPTSEKDVIHHGEKTTSLPDVTDQIQTGTTPIKEYTQEQQDVVTQVPMHRVTTEEPDSKAPATYITDEYVTGIPESSTKPDGPKEVDSETIPTEISRTSEKAEETTEPGVLFTESHDHETKQPSVSKTQEQSTELPISSEDIETEQPEVQVTSETPQSLVTGHSEFTTSIFKEDSQEPELVTAKVQETTKMPELPVSVSVQEELQTDAPVYMTEHDLKETATEVIEEIGKVTKVPEETVTEKQETLTTLRESSSPSQEEPTEKPQIDTKPHETTESQAETSETTTDLIILEEHTHKMAQDITTELPTENEVTDMTGDTSTLSPYEEHTSKVTEHILSELPFDADRTTVHVETGHQYSEPTTEKTPEKDIEIVTKDTIVEVKPSEDTPIEEGVTEKVLDTVAVEETTAATVQGVDGKYTIAHKEYTTTAPTLVSEETTPEAITEPARVTVSETGITGSRTKEPTATDKPTHETTVPEDELLFSTTKATTVRQEEEISDDKVDKPEGKPSETSEVPQKSTTADVQKPSITDTQPTEKIPEPEEEFPSMGPNGYGEPDYIEEDQAFGPGTCRYGGKVYVSAQQIPRDDPCDFCFCFRSDIICLQQSCPPPIHGCHEEPIQGFCCPRYECPVSMATTVNVTTTTTTTTTTLPPHFPTHSYKGAAQRRGCQIKGHTYKVGEVVRSSSGPCLHCTCGGDGQMKCDPKACTPEPMLRQMIAAAVSAKRRR